MSEVVVQEVPETNVSAARRVKEKVLCHKCGSERVHRVFREGFLQERFYPLFGYYPWRCKTCGTLVMLRKRHRTKIHKGEAGKRERRRA